MPRTAKNYTENGGDTTVIGGELQIGKDSKVTGYDGKNLGLIAHLHAENPTAAAADSILTATTLTSEVQEITEGITNPDYPRVLQIVGNAAGITGNVAIAGTNYADEVIVDTIALNGDTPVEGTKAFKTVTSIQLPVETNVGTDTVSVGVTEKLGLQYKLAHDTVIFAFLNNTREANDSTVTVDVDNLEKNTIKLNSALDGSPVDVYFVV